MIMKIRNNPVSGTEPSAVPGRGYLYVEMFPGDDSNDLLDSVVDSISSCEGPPKDGGTMRDFFDVVCPDGSRFVCFTYRGDIVEWERLWKSYLASKGRRWAKVDELHVTIDNGPSYAHAVCKFHLFDSKTKQWVDS
jgi:hypothetical protein